MTETVKNQIEMLTKAHLAWVCTYVFVGNSRLFRAIYPAVNFLATDPGLKRNEPVHQGITNSDFSGCFERIRFKIAT